MNLNLSLPPRLQSLWDARIGEPILYCAPFDIDQRGTLQKGGYVVVSRHTCCVLQGDDIQISFPLTNQCSVACKGQIGCGYLTLNEKGTAKLLCRFSTGQVARFSYIAKAINRLCNGDETPVVSKEQEQICPKCGGTLHGTAVCQKCESGKASFKRMFAICKPFAPRFIVIWLLMLATTAITLYLGQWERNYIDRHLNPGQGTTEDILIFVGVLTVFTVIAVIINLVKRYYGVVLGSKMSNALRSALFQKVQMLSLSYHDSRKPGDLMNRITNDTGQVRMFMENVFTNMFSYIVTFFGALILMMIMDWQLTLLSLIFTPFVWGFNRLFHRKMRRLFPKLRRREDALNSRLQDVLQGIKVVKTFGKEDYETKRFEEENDRVAQWQEKSECFWGTFQPVMNLIFNLGSAVVLIAGGYKVLTGTGFTVGQMAQYIGYANLMFGPLGWFSHLPRMLMNLRISLSRIDDVMAQTEELPVADQPKMHDIQGEIAFHNVTFGYKAYEPVLDGISFTVKPGESIGLVGSSGTGKSTMINLIMRLYDVNSGSITVDGIDLRELDQTYYHSQLGIVLQENFLFSGTILENIRFAKPEATLKEVIAAAKTAGAHDFICKFSDGYNTMVGEKGQRLSGGERQRIAIARAVLRNPKLLILDEATSSLDTESEFAISTALERLKKGKTSFSIAHRLSTLQGCDRIFVIDKHNIVQMGTHQELMNEEGIYKNLVDAQLEMHALKSIEK